MRDRLIDLLENNPTLDGMDGTSEDFAVCADYLLENGVIVPPCKVGYKLYYITLVKTIEECIVHAVECEENKITVKCHLWRKEREALLHKHLAYFNIADFGKTVFLTKEEAEKALTEVRKL